MIVLALTTTDVVLLILCFISLIGTIALCLFYREKWITCIKKKPSLDVTFEPYPGPWTDSAVDTK
ncbi:hypothetical protein BgiMline_019714, partial [Biomphalaria glabrata]